MGRPKQLVLYRGLTLLERVHAAVEPHVARVVLLGDGPVPPDCADLPRLADASESAGPLAGMLAALRWAPQAAWLIAACDLPYLEPSAVRWLLAQRSPSYQAVVPRNPAGLAEPLLAVYEPGARELVADLLARGRRAPRELADYAQVHTPTLPPHLARAWRGVNSPAELDELQA